MFTHFQIVLALGYNKPFTTNALYKIEIKEKRKKKKRKKENRVIRNDFTSLF